MSGKPKVKPSVGWGGKRLGAGVKGLTVSEKQAREIKRILRKREKLEGRKWQDILLDFVFGHQMHEGRKIDMGLKEKERIAAMRLLADIALVKSSEQNVTVTKNDGPTIYLPELRKPGELVAIEGGKESSDTGT